ncbi:MAG: cupin domain-containing protein, partial [Alphaproteobacteria bacterium]
AELERLHPGMLEDCRLALAGAAADLDFLRLAAEPLGRAPALSIDYAVMEHTDRAAVVPVDFGWSDVGAWNALWEIADKDAAGNVVQGPALLADVRDSYLRSEDGRLVAAVGLTDAVVVATSDAVLVAPRDRAEEVKALVERLKAEGRPEADWHPRVYRPWGSYQEVDAGDRFKVKRIVVKPGGQLSLQRHARRAEHWVVVRGVARVTRGASVVDLGPDQSIYIPLGEVHRLENPGVEPVHLIEVQTGDYLGEDDIERIEDRYGRD